jgi:hypothetical protein
MPQRTRGLPGLAWPGQLSTGQLMTGQTCNSLFTVPLRLRACSTYMDAYDTYLVLTFVGETRVLGINAEEELDEAEIAGFDANAQARARQGGARPDFEVWWWI